MIAKRHRASDFPPRRRDICHKAIRSRDPGHGEHTGRRRHDNRLARTHNGPRGGDRASHSKHGRNPQRPSDAVGCRVVSGRHERGIGHGSRVEPLSEASDREGLVGEVFFRHKQQIEIAGKLKVLETVVQHVDGGTESSLGKRPREMPVRPDEDRNARQCARQHQWLIACRIEVGQNSRRIRNDRHTVVGNPPRVAACQDGRALTAVLEEARDMLDHRRLPAATHAKVADAHHGPREPAAL